MQQPPASPDRYTDEEWNFIVRNTRTPSVNVVIQNSRGEILHLLRARQPAKGLYWVVGGREKPMKDLATGQMRMETLKEAAFRVAKDEVGFEPESLEFVGLSNEYQEEHFSTEGWDPEDLAYYGPDVTSIDYISTVAYFRLLDDSAPVKLDGQSKDYQWSAVPMNDHEYHRGYFEMLRRMGHDIGGTPETE